MFTNENMNKNNCFLQNKDSGIIKRNSKVLIFPPPILLFLRRCMQLSYRVTLYYVYVIYKETPCQCFPCDYEFFC